MKEHLSPFASIVAWCLMPNHFHWVVFVHRDSIVLENSRHPNSSRETTQVGGGLPTKSSGDHYKTQTINQSIGILLSSYTRALQKQEKFTGSLFQKRTKAKPLIDEIRIDAPYWNTTFGTEINISEGKNYLETCVEYVHQNPEYGGLVANAENWEFSSFRDYLGLGRGKLIDYKLIKENGLLAHDKKDETLSTDGRDKNTVIIAIGSNIRADENIAKMLEILQGKVQLVKVSGMVQTKPIGIENQPDFTNGAVKIKTPMDERELNLLLKNIENQMGRDRKAPKFGPRCIDLDIVVWNGKIVDDDYYTRDFIRKSVEEIQE